MATEDRTEPLALVGIGCLFPKAAGPGFYWANVKHGADCVAEVPPTHWDPADYFDADPKSPDMTYARRGGFLDAVEFDPLEFGIAPRDLEATDTTQLLGLVAAKQALTDAGVTFADGAVDRSRVSVILGVTGTLELVIPLGARLGHPRWKKAMRAAGVPDEQAADAAARIADSYVPWQENSFPGLLGNVVAGRIANRLDLHGTNCVVDAACASSLSAVHLAALELQTGRADVAVTGGCDTFNDIFMYMCFSKTPALSPTGDAKPFDADGDGTILGEGIGVVVLKRLADAERDGDRVYAVLRGLGSGSDGKGTAIYAPSADGQKRCLLAAYREAGITPDTVELVEAHGTGTRVGDATEAAALIDVYSTVSDASKMRPPRPWAAVGSVKSQVGHTKAAAGAASLIKVALALHHKVLPPTIKVTRPVEPLADPDSPFYVNTAMRPWLPRPDHPRRAALSAFGFGGSNFHAVLEEHRPGKTEVDWDGSVEVVALGADSPERLAAQLADVPTDWPAFARFAEQSRAAFDVSAACRLCFAAHRTLTDLPKLLAGAKAKLASDPAGEWATVEGACYGTGPARGSVAVLFPGQGSQAVGMLRDLACLFPEVLGSLAAADAAVAAAATDESDALRLSDRIYPPTSFDPGAAARRDADLRQTQHAQPALGAVSWGAWRVLADRFGVEAAAFAGHSYGELVALAAAGRLAPADLFALSRLRGRLMGEQRPGDPGAMLAVLAPLPDVERVLAEGKFDLTVANRNGPRQAVLSGATAEVEKAEAALAAAGLRCARLPVAAAFHSPLVADAAAPFRAGLEGVAFAAGAAPVYSNTTAAAYPADPAAARDLLGEQLARPVAFAEQVRAMADAGVRTFLEVGPGAVLTKLVESILAGADGAAAIALDATGGRRPGVLDLGAALARLAARGHRTDLAAWERGSRCRPAPAARPGRTVPLTGANHVTPRPPRPPAAPPDRRAEANGTHHPSPPTRVRLDHPVKAPAMSDPDPGSLARALQATQQSLAALQRMQEQTAALHKQFLDGQDAAHRTLHALVEQQQTLLLGGLGAAAPLPALPPAPVAAPVVPPPPAPVPAAPPPAREVELPPPPPAPADDPDVGAAVLAVVAEKTGYGADSLGLDMALDADLGVDSIKRVEILAALQDRLPAAPAVRPEHLPNLRTLRDLAHLLAAPPAGPAEPPRPPAAPASGNGVGARENGTGVRAVEAAGAAVLAVVAEKTGYGADSLGLDMALDADLGVDSIKRVEILAALQDRLPAAPAVRPEHLPNLRTLRDLAHLLAARPDPGPPTAKIPIPVHPFAPAAPAEAPAPAAGSAVRRPPEAPPAVVIDRSVLRVADLDPAGPRPRVALPAGAEVWVVGGADPLPAAVAAALAGRGLKPKALGWTDPAPDKAAGPLAGLILVAPPDPAPDLNRRAFGWVKAAGPRLRQAGRAGAAVLATVARLDGAFGLANLSADADPTAGGLAGLAKTARHEWPEVACKALDVDPGFADAAAAAAAVADEVLAVGPAEVGVAATHRCTPELARAARRPGPPPLDLGPKDVVLVTGGARGVTAEAAVALAEAFGPTLVLTGRTPPPGPEPAWLAGVAGEAELKKAIAGHLGPGAAPRQVGEQYQRVLAGREVRRTLDRLAGHRAWYAPVDITDRLAVADLLRQVRERYGPVTAVVHGAGVLADRRVEDLTGEQFDHVYATKVGGLRNLLDLLGPDGLKALVLFSSTTARLGRAGQAAYACANEVLNKAAQAEARRRPGCRVVAVNWGPWDGGMVTPGLRRVFEAEGVGLIPPADGAAFLVQELTAAGRAVEVVALARPPGAPGSGILPAGSGATPPPAATPAAAPDLAPAFERAVDADTHPVLKAHVLDGRAVLPLAVHLEWLAHAALHGNPGLVFHGFNDLRVTSAVQVDGAGPAHLRALAGRAVKQGKTFVVPVELRGRRRDGRDAVHSRAEIVLAAALPPAPPADRPPAVSAVGYTVAEAYRDRLFHGPELRGIEAVAGASYDAFIGTARPAPPPAEWFRAPLRSGWVADPLVLDASFQMMILWTQARHGTGSLPCFAGRYRQYRKGFPADPTTVVIRVRRDDGTFARADIDYLDADGRVVAQMQDYECVMEKTLNQAFRKNQLVRR